MKSTRYSKILLIIIATLGLIGCGQGSEGLLASYSGADVATQQSIYPDHFKIEDTSHEMRQDLTGQCKNNISVTLATVASVDACHMLPENFLLEVEQLDGALLGTFSQWDIQDCQEPTMAFRIVTEACHDEAFRIRLIDLEEQVYDQVLTKPFFAHPDPDRNNMVDFNSN